MDELSNATQNLQLQHQENNEERTDRQQDAQRPTNSTPSKPNTPNGRTNRQKHSNTQTDTQCLHDAVRRRDSYGIQKKLVSSEPEAVNVTDEAGRTALHVAVQENCLQVQSLNFPFPLFLYCCLYRQLCG